MKAFFNACWNFPRSGFILVAFDTISYAQFRYNCAEREEVERRGVLQKHYEVLLTWHRL